jgi:hypothetical protein
MVLSVCVCVCVEGLVKLLKFLYVFLYVPVVGI